MYINIFRNYFFIKFQYLYIYLCKNFATDLNSGRLTQIEIEKARKKRFREKMCIKILIEIFIYVMFMSLLYVVAYNNQNTFSNLYKTTLTNLFTTQNNYIHVT